MPLFHIHGLMAGVLASLHAGGTVICTPGFNALRVFGWLDGMAPTWLTAVPTMHQAILARAARNRAVIARRRLRLLRSSSSSLPAPVMEELEAAFDAPVIESYGMTEASHQMTSNPMPPAERRPGGVGPRGRSRDRDHGRGRHPAAAGHEGRGGDPRCERHPGLREQPRGQRRGVHRTAGSAPATRA